MQPSQPPGWRNPRPDSEKFPRTPGRAAGCRKRTLKRRLHNILITPAVFLPRLVALAAAMIAIPLLLATATPGEARVKVKTGSISGRQRSPVRSVSSSRKRTARSAFQKVSSNRTA